MKKVSGKAIAIGVSAAVLLATAGIAGADGVFSDVSSGAWYSAAVNWAKDNGVMNGTSSTTFSPDSPVTRAQLAQTLYNMAQKGMLNGASVAAAPTKAHLYMDILTGRMDGRPGWPMFSPADFTVPANADVTVTVRDWDDGTAPVPAQYAQVTGTTDGSETVVASAYDNTAPSQTITSMDPNNVAHTFTISALNLNVPIPPTSTVTFTFHTPSTPGTYTWNCMAPCGTGPDGMGGPMVTDGWMTGTMTVK